MDGSSVQRSGSTSGALGSPARSRLASTATLPASARPHGHRGQTPPKRSRRKLSRPRFDCQPHRLHPTVTRPEIPMIPASRNRLQKSRLPRVGWPGLFGTCADGSLVAPGLSRHGGLSNGQFISRLRIIFFFRGLDLSLAGHAPPSLASLVTPQTPALDCQFGIHPIRPLPPGRRFSSAPSCSGASPPSTETNRFSQNHAGSSAAAKPLAPKVKLGKACESIRRHLPACGSLCEIPGCRSTPTMSNR